MTQIRMEAELNCRNPGESRSSGPHSQLRAGIWGFPRAHPAEAPSLQGSLTPLTSSSQRTLEHLFPTFSHIPPLSPACHGKQELQILRDQVHEELTGTSLRKFPTPGSIHHLPLPAAHPAGQAEGKLRPQHRRGGKRGQK